MGCDMPDTAAEEPHSSTKVHLVLKVETWSPFALPSILNWKNVDY
jgi:hypothetical protein